MILSKFIVKEWFKSLLAALFVLFLLMTTADLINGFLQGKEGERVLLEYMLKVPNLMSKMIPICCLVATLFSLNKLKAHSELISILAAGYSYIRIYLLIGVCALTVVALQFFNMGFLEPMANKVKRQEIQKSQRSEGKYLTRSSIDGGKFWFKSRNYFASFDFFDRERKLLSGLQIYFFSAAHKSARIIKSERAIYKEKDHWVLQNVRELSSLDETTFPVETKRDSIELSLNEVPEDFGEFEADLTTLNFFKLNNFIQRLSKTGINIDEYKVILWNMAFMSFVCFVFALIPLSQIFNPNRRSSSFGKNVVLTLLIAIGFWVLYSMSVALGNSGRLPPIVATGIIPILALCFVIYTFMKNRNLSM